MRGVVSHGERIRNARIAHGLTQEQLAARADVDVKTIRKAEQGKRLDVDTLARLARALQIEVGEVVARGSSSDGPEEVRRQVVQSWVAAWDAQDIEALLALYHDDAVMHLPSGPGNPFGGRFAGKAAIRQCNQQAWDTIKTLPARDGDFSIVVVDDTAVLQGTKRICLPDGREVPLTSIHMYKFAGDRIIEMRVEYDTLAVDRLSREPPAGSDSSPYAPTIPSIG